MIAPVVNVATDPRVYDKNNACVVPTAWFNTTSTLVKSPSDALRAKRRDIRMLNSLTNGKNKAAIHWRSGVMAKSITVITAYCTTRAGTMFLFKL